MLTCSARFRVTRFPCGEPHVVVADYGLMDSVDVGWEFERADEWVELALLVDALKRGPKPLRNLSIPYIPFSRQDRVANPGEAHSLRVFCEMINGLGFERVEVIDPHSDVSTALINNIKVFTQAELFAPRFEHSDPFWLVSPDAGALKKVNQLAALTSPLGIIECSKKRDTKTGAITDTVVRADDLGGHPCAIVDDICDGGRTFIEIAKRLQERRAGAISLMVSHGFFTQGLAVFDGLIDHIYTRKGQVK